MGYVAVISEKGPTSEAIAGEEAHRGIKKDRDIKSLCS